MTRVFTVMFTDIKGFTARTSARSRTELRRLLDTHEELLRPLFKLCGGQVVMTLGDAFKAVFESPTNAIICGMLIQETLRIYNGTVKDTDRFEVRVAMNTGECEIGREDVVGEAVNIAGGIEKVAEAGEVWFSEGTLLNIRDPDEIPMESLGAHKLAGIPRDVTIWRAVRTGYEERWAELFARARSGKISRTERLLPFTYGGDDDDSHHHRLRRATWVSLAIVALVVLVIGAVLALSQGNGEDQRIDDAIAAAEQQIAAGDPRRAFSELVEATGTVNFPDRALRTLANAVITEAERIAEVGSLEDALAWVDAREAQVPRLQSMLASFRSSLVQTRLSREVEAAREYVATEPPTDETGRAARDEKIDAIIARLVSLHRAWPKQQLDRATAEVIRTEFQYLLAADRYERAHRLINVASTTSDLLVHMMPLRRRLKATEWDYRVQLTIVEADELCKTDPAAALATLYELLREEEDDRVVRAVVRALVAQAEWHLRNRRHDLVLPSLDRAVERVPALGLRLSGVRMDFEQRVQRAEAVAALRVRTTQRLDSERLMKEAEALLAEHPDAADVREVYVEARTAACDSLMRQNKFVEAVRLMDTTTTRLAWLEPDEEAMRAMFHRGAEQLEPFVDGQRLTFWEMAYKRYHETDPMLMLKGAEFWSIRRNGEARDFLRAALDHENRQLVDEHLDNTFTRRLMVEHIGSSPAVDVELARDYVARMPREEITLTLRDLVLDSRVSNRHIIRDLLDAIDGMDAELEMHFHWLNIHAYTTSERGQRLESIGFFRQLHADGQLTARLDAMDRPLDLTQLSGLSDPFDEARTRLVVMLRECFIDRLHETLLRGVVSPMNAVYRITSLEVLRGTAYEAQADLWAHHDMNIVDYTTIRQYPFVKGAIDYFAGHAGGEKAAEALKVLQDAQKHLHRLVERAVTRTQLDEAEAVNQWFTDAIAKFNDGDGDGGE